MSVARRFGMRSRLALRSVLVLLLLPGLLGSAVAGPLAGDADSAAARATLKWTSKDDSGLYGYLVYRSEKREGPFRRINREIVHVTEANDEGISAYVYVDTDVSPGRTYYYYLDMLATNGRKQRFSGVVAKSVAER